MKLLKQTYRPLAAVIAMALVIGSGAVWAAIAQTPLFLVPGAKPRVMLAMSVDHQLFKKAYPDYNDLNNDGVVDTTYTDTFDYDGYFDSGRCYEYSSGVFEPEGEAGGANGHDCTASDEWSGNFLNWATMTRIDVLRKVLYGGRRSTDSSTVTILERALLPQDVHAFVKVYRAASGTEMQRFTPYSDTTKLSMCNVTLGATDVQSQSVDRTTTPSVMRVAKDAYPLWATNEVTQCVLGSGTLPSSVTADLKVRVRVCVAGKLEDNCTTYGSSSKPTGILQQYGEDGTLKFGLVSGSYGASHSGGLLRRALGSLAGNPAGGTLGAGTLNEIDTSSGVFTNNAGIISTLNNVRINRWRYGIGSGRSRYQDCYAYGTPAGNTATNNSGYLSPDNRYSGNDATCSNWGNPVAELYLETLRYLAGDEDGTPTPNSVYAIPGGYTDETTLGLPNITSWSDPVPDSEWCAPLNVLLISSSDNSFDTDDLNNVPSALGSVNDSVDAIGTNENLSGSVFAGESNGVVDQYCTPKAFNTLSSVKGICPTAPALVGGYHVAGLAYKSHVTDLRPTMTGDQKVDTFVVSLAKELPEFTFPVGADGKKVTVIPTCTARVANEAATGGNPCSLTDLTVLETVVSGGKLTYARFLASWEDSLWGADYDKDGISMIAICVGAECANHDDDKYYRSGSFHNVGNESAVSSDQVRVTAWVVNAAGGADLRFGYSIAGTTNDGRHETVMRPGNRDGNVLDSDLNPVLAMSTYWDTPEAVVFTAGSSSGTILPNPLIYAAKYGGFDDADNSGTPNTTAEWDADNDGQPDNYFFADNPGLLGAKLAEFFGTINTNASSASVVANAAVLDANTRIYQAQFNSDGWFGHLYSFPVNVATGVLEAAEWDAATKITAQDPNTGREIITWRPATTGADAVTASGVAFRWAADQTYMNTDQKTLLNKDKDGVTDNLGADRVSYLRGANVAGFRSRLEEQSFGTTVPNVLGDIVHSTPALVGNPNFNYPDSIEPSAPYSTFKASYATTPRTTMVYVGSNDGMLHAIDATPVTGGAEKFAYVPNAVIANLSALTSPDYTHRYYADGPPTVVDAYIGTAWRTILVAGLRGGGKAVYALDVTDPTAFSEANAASIVKWELDDDDLSGLGYTFSQPAVFKEEGSGTWVAAFGNGYGGTGAKLYIVQLSNGAVLRTIPLDASSGNGLATISPVDTNNNGLVDLIYAGDLEGNVYRLKVGSGGFDSGSGKSTTTLYTAKTAANGDQAITTRIEVGVHPLSNTGRMVYFGTGTYYLDTDNEPGTQTNTMYGIWDKDVPDTVASVTTRTSTVLQKQEVIVTTTLSGQEVRVVSDNSIDWSTQRGWYLDLPTTGERMATDMVLRGGRLIFVTVIPSSMACEAGGDSWLMEVNSATGGRLYVTVFDIDGDGTFDLDDMTTITNPDGTTSTVPVSGRKFDSIVQRPSIIRVGTDSASSNGGKEFKYLSSSDGSIKQVTESDPFRRGRKSWLQFQ